jgi:hypothetical protein
MIAEAIETCWWLMINDETLFIRVHLLVLLHEFKYSLNVRKWNILRSLPFVIYLAPILCPSRDSCIIPVVQNALVFAILTGDTVGWFIHSLVCLTTGAWPLPKQIFCNNFAARCNSKIQPQAWGNVANVSASWRICLDQTSIKTRVSSRHGVWTCCGANYFPGWLFSFVFFKEIQS